jgi:hypothetical protein
MYVCSRIQFSSFPCAASSFVASRPIKASKGLSLSIKCSCDHSYLHTEFL